MPDMSEMPGTGGLEPLTWGRFFGTWDIHLGWLIGAVVLLVGYLLAWSAAGASSTVRTWRVASFVTGVVLLWVTVSSAIGAYAMALFWMHMVMHLLLIMVVPALLVLGHPLTVLAEGGPPVVGRVLRSRATWLLTHQVTGVVVYTVVIVGTHLTGFMDAMARHGWLMWGEQILYVVAGWLLLTPLIGEESVRANPPYLLRILVLVAAMIPDTIVGIVLLQAGTVPFPVLMGRRPSWALDALSDVHTAGGLMWAGGDGLMMFIAVGLMISVITSPGRRLKMTGAWLDGARRAALAAHSGGSDDAAADVDPDSDEAHDAYNRMLAQLRERERGRP